ncbi:PH domain-containing protein [Salinibacterium soli]|uniref:PH domain-containing protein n=1 Tax=Antiquaquibacter soli TaxID=3064523 RepID=A0ABT9BJA7_9MICO|nr:PH domain-containing protein [Protaetiibacter sp. WY-16]MDO7881102.1 PH domain-containing protein [Protaetiibacter sp. WY-16]
MSVLPSAEPERVLARVHSHARAMVLPSLFLLAVCAGLGYIGGRLPEAWQNLAVLGLAALLVVVGWLVPLVRWLARTVTITSRRAVLRSGVVVRTRQEVLHSRIYEVTVRKSAMQSLVGSGDVLLGVGAGRPVVLRDIPSPDLVADALHELMDATRPTGDVNRFG